MNRYKGSLERYLEAKAHTDNIQQNYQYQKDMIMQQQQQVQFINNIVAKVLQEISVSADTKEAVLKIEELRQIIDKLGK